jgi:hypothetical protein
MSDQPKKVHFGEGVLRPGTRPIKVYVDENGEYYICDADVDPSSPDFEKEGCVGHSEFHIAEGG